MVFMMTTEQQRISKVSSNNEASTSSSVKVVDERANLSLTKGTC